MNKTRALRIYFDGFWPGFAAEHFFLPFIATALERPVESARHPRETDIRLYSVFNRARNRLSFIRPYQKSRALKIWFTGENIRPPYGQFDLTLSFDIDSFEGSNLYFPLAYLSVKWPWQPVEFSGNLSKEASRSGQFPTVESLATPRKLDPTRPKFACMFVSNLTSERKRLIDALSKIGDVDVYGPGSRLGAVKDKFSVARNYRFIICPENDLYPGYVTEKLVDAWSAGCVPIWSGIDAGHLFNPESYLNLYTETTLSAAIDKVHEFDLDPALREQIINSPLTESPWDLSAAAETLRVAYHSSQLI